MHAAVTPEDSFLIAAVRGGDSAALGQLIRRYDRLVRYTAYKVSGGNAAKDVFWIDSIASETWEGFVGSIQRQPHRDLGSVAAYLSRIARNRAVDAIRERSRRAEPQSLEAVGADSSIVADQADPADDLERIEQLTMLKACLAELNDDDRTLYSQLTAITERRWRQAAEALSIKESTLRSRWKGVLKRLGSCLARKNRENVAPGGFPGD